MGYFVGFSILEKLSSPKRKVQMVGGVLVLYYSILLLLKK
jgi:hypothetical protein